VPLVSLTYPSLTFSDAIPVEHVVKHKGRSRWLHQGSLPGVLSAESARTLAFSDADAFALLFPVALMTFSRVTSGTVHLLTDATQDMHSWRSSSPVPVPRHNEYQHGCERMHGSAAYGTMTEYMLTLALPVLLLGPRETEPAGNTL
jgi:hypothetical protein